MLTSRRLLVVTAVLLSLVRVSAGVIYSGSLSSDDGGILGTGPWVTDASPTTMSWTVDNETTPNYWHYSYTFTVPTKDISHHIIEASTTLTSDDILNLAWSGGVTEIQTQKESQGNPNLPSTFYGIRLEPTAEDTTMTFSFDTVRDPIWGDFYAKDGDGGGSDITAWNAGFGTAAEESNTADTHYDPTDGPSGGSIRYHLLIPDTIPEPSTMLLLALGSVVLMLRRRRK